MKENKEKREKTWKIYANATNHSDQCRKSDLTAQLIRGTNMQDQWNKGKHAKDKQQQKRGFTDSPLLKGIAINLRNIRYLDIIIYINLIFLLLTFYI